ncbi:MAG: TetR family transcriptional regulator [Xanthobacteraceae bacterium]|nr:TetR family transcriptional regulator [Xanthobacteraceae bacterium]
MTMVSEHTEAEAQERILVEAERLFREIGYQKTTVADIAKALRMSPANVYRFFPSKDAIRHGVAFRLMSEVEAAAAAIVARPAPAPQRLRELVTAIHLMNTERYVGDAKLHEMVASAMEEDWDVCKAHIERVTLLIGGVIGEGAAEGAFRVADVRVAALCTCTAMLRFFHPQMIAQTANKPGPTLDQMIDFILVGLGYHHAA